MPKNLDPLFKRSDTPRLAFLPAHVTHGRGIQRERLMMKRLFQSLRRLFIVALVGVFISVGTFTQKAAAAAPSVQDACTITEKIGQPFENPPFAYADKTDKADGSIILNASKDTFKLDKDYDGYLYQATYYDANGDLVKDKTPQYTPPTLVVSPGNSIDLTLTNNLPINVQLAGKLPPTEENLQNQSQDTNLHYHGFNVSPLLGSDDVVMHVHSNRTNPSIVSGGLYPDDDPKSPKYGSIADYHMRVNLPKGHQSGLFWYHPHAHTVSNNQVRAGMSGGIIVNGIEKFYKMLENNPIEGIQVMSGSPAPPTTQPTQLAITQQVMLFKDFNDVLGDGGANCFTLNGQIRPTIRIESGEVQFWRIGNIGADTYLNLALQHSQKSLIPPAFYILARDGGAVYKPIKTEKVLLPPASRVELLVVGGESSQDYDLVSKSSSKVTAYDGTLAKVIVGGASTRVTYRCPHQVPTGSCTPGTEITDMEKYITSQHATQIDDRVRSKTANGGNKANSSSQPTYERTLDNILPDPKLLAGYGLCKPGDDHTKCITPGNEYPDEPLTQKRTFTFKSSPDFTKFTINGKLYDENRIDKVSHLGDNEEWTVVNNDPSSEHAFHMHQLDFLVTKVTLPDNPGSTYDNYNIVDGKCDGEKPPYTCDLEPQGYRDTINLPPNSTTTIRIPFLNPFITGVFVYHCHILGHEDSGMMQNLKVIDPKNYKSTSGLVSNS